MGSAVATSAVPAPTSPNILVSPIHWVGHPKDQYDIVILGDGFSREEMLISSHDALRGSKFGRWATRAATTILKTEPFRGLRHKLNIWMIAVPSKESGIDDPFRSIERDSFLGVSRGGGENSRLLVVKRRPLLKAVAQLLPGVDHVVVIANSGEHGGTGRDFSIISMDPDTFDSTLLHELGHSIGHLGDTYLYFGRGENGAGQVEQYRSNLTSDPAQIPWRDFLNPGFPQVEFLHPNESVRRSREGDVLAAFFTADRDIEDLILLPTPRNDFDHSILKKMKGLWVNDRYIDKNDIKVERRPFRYRRSHWLSFLRVPYPTIPKGARIEIKMSFHPLSDGTGLMSWYEKHTSVCSDREGLSIVSQVFTPGELGLFRFGGGDQVFWRSSYGSRMMFVGRPFDAWEKHVIREEILKVTSRLQLPSGSLRISDR